MVHLGSLVLPYVIDTGSFIFVLSLALSRRLIKALLPPQGPVLKSAFNSISIPLDGQQVVFTLILCFPSEFSVPKNRRTILSSN